MSGALIEAALVLRLRAAMSGVAIAWDERPRSAPVPAVVMTMIYPGLIETIEATNALRNPRVQFDCWAAGSAAAAVVADQVEAAMQIAPHTEITFGGVTFFNGWVEDRRSFAPEDMSDGGDIKYYRRMLDIAFFCKV